MQGRGKQHEVEPEADSLSLIDFEDEGRRAGEWGSTDRFVWHREMVRHVVFEVTGGPANLSTVADTGEQLITAITDALVLANTGDTSPFDLNEESLWQDVARFANAKGFDTYDSDTRFELFPGGTPEDDPTAPLRNTEQGDVCVTHGGTWEGTYSDKLDEGDPDPQPICSEVDFGFEPYSDLCRFVPADSTDDARINTPDERDLGSAELEDIARIIDARGFNDPLPDRIRAVASDLREAEQS